MIKNEKKLRWVAIGSVALNIFLVAFLLGRGAGFCETSRCHGKHQDKAFMGSHFMMPGKVFSREEMEQERPYMKAQFGKIRELRKDFGEQLKNNQVTTESMRVHFQKVDNVMAEIKDHFHEKLIVKINGMSAEERRELGEELIKGKHKKDKKDKGDRE